MADSIVTKTCSKCEKNKPLGEFCRNRTKKGGLETACKTCASAYERSEAGKARQKRYAATEKRRVTRQRHKSSEKCKATQQRYERTEAAKDSHRRYNSTAKGQISRAKIMKRHRATEKYKATSKRYRTQHPDQNNARMTIGLAVRSGTLPRASTLFCHNCGEPAQQWHHHKGYAPEHRLDVIPVCKKCHSHLHSVMSHSIRL